MTSVRRRGVARFVAACGLVVSVLAPVAGQTPPTPERVASRTGLFRLHAAFHSQFVAKDRDVLVYLPPGYDAPENRTRRYPVLYLHDGQNVFDGATSFIPGKEWRADEAAEELIKARMIEPLLIVGVYNAGEERVHEYTPTVEARFKAGGRADAYGRMLVEELKPFIDRMYRTKPGAADTGLGGSSLGGLVTLHLGLKYPETFGRLAVVSPSVWWDDQQIVREVLALPLTRRPDRIYLDIGTKEGRDAADALSAVRDARFLRDALVARGWLVGKTLVYTEAEGAEHTESAWAARVGPILRFLFPRQP